MFLPTPGGGTAPPGEQPAHGQGAPKYYSLQSTSAATNSRNTSTVRRETSSRRRAGQPLGVTGSRTTQDGTARNRLSRLADGSVIYEKGGQSRRRREEGTGTGTGTGATNGAGALVRSTSQRGRQDRRVYATVQPQNPGIVGGQLCSCGYPAVPPHIHSNLFAPALNYTLPHNYSIYTPYGPQLPPQYYTLSHPHHQQFIAQAAAAPPPSATASVAYSEHHPNSELYRIFKQSQIQNALPAPSETSEGPTGQSPGSREFVPISATGTPSYGTYGVPQVQVAATGPLPLAGPVPVPAFQMPVGAAALPVAPVAAGGAVQSSARNSYATYRPAPRALVQNYPNPTASTADAPVQVVLRNRTESRPQPQRPADSLHEPVGNVPSTVSVTQAIPAPFSVSFPVPPLQPALTADSTQNAGERSTPSRPLILKDSKCTISFV